MDPRIRFSPDTYPPAHLNPTDDVVVKEIDGRVRTAKAGEVCRDPWFFLGWEFDDFYRAQLILADKKSGQSE